MRAQPRFALPRRLVTLLAAMSLTACPSLGPSAPESVHAKGEWQHPDSKLDFPTEVAGFRRVGIQEYSSDGRSIGVGYNHSAPVAFTVFVRPTGQVPLIEQFVAEKDVIFEYHPGGKLLHERDGLLETGSGSVPARYAEFRYHDLFAGQHQLVISQLHLFERDGRFVKYRLTFPAIEEDRARAAARQMLENAPWGRRGEGAS